MSGSKGPRSSPVHVGIVGAGLAGLRCADVLLQHGCKVTIFEARNRLGGRVAQSRHLGHSVDLGANWIHGTEGNVINDIAKQIGSKLFGWDEDQAMFDSEGHLMDLDDAAEYGEMLWDDEFIPAAFKHSKAHSASIDAGRSLYDFFVERAAETFRDESPDLAHRKREIFLQTTDVWGGWVGTPVEKQSLKFFWMEQCLDGENPFVADTYAGILAYVAKRAVERADIRYECEVARISSTSLDEQSGLARPTIECSNGVVESFDAVVVTTPLGWLKKNQDAFKPALPPRLSQAIGNIGYGTLDKVYIGFPSAFWDEPRTTSSKLPNGVDAESKGPNVRAAKMPVHQPPSQQSDEPHYPSISVFLSPTYAPDTNPGRVYQECFNLSALPGSCAHPTLLFYIYGDISRHIGSIVLSAATSASADASVLEFFRPYYSRLPNYDPSNPACKPKAVLATAWANDKWAGYGSYSNFQVGSQHADEDMEVMGHGMPERSVYLAGEHTAPIVASGTTTGAYVSGELVAKRIFEAFEIGGSG